MSYIGNQPTNVAFLTDSLSGNGSTTAFTMQVAPANTSSVLVAISGVLQDPSTYSVLGTTLTFSAAPPTGTNNISVRYMGIPASGVTTTAYRTVTEFTATAGQTSFSVPSYTVGYLDVYRSGSQLGSTDYTASNGTTVVLAAAATAGELVRIVSFYVSSVLNAIPATDGAVNSTYLADGAVQTAKLDAAAVTQEKMGTNVAGNGPAFSAYMNANQTLSNQTTTKIQYNTEEYDTASCYDVSTYRFLPLVAGYYSFTAAVQMANSCAVVLYVSKNGSPVKSVSTTVTGTNSNTMTATVYLNGSTDYVEMYCYQSSGGNLGILGTAQWSFFQGAMVRAA